MYGSRYVGWDSYRGGIRESSIASRVDMGALLPRFAAMDLADEHEDGIVINIRSCKAFSGQMDVLDKKLEDPLWAVCECRSVERISLLVSRNLQRL